MPIQKIFTSLDISASGMSAQRRRMNAVASNIANLETTRTENGEPYRRKVVLMQTDTTGQTFEQVLQNEDRRIKVTNPRHIRTVPAYGAEDGVGAPVTTDLKTIQDNAFRLVYDPDHPDANADGYVRMPNINVITEMVDMITASRSYEANATAIESSKNMSKRALDI